MHWLWNNPIGGMWGPYFLVLYFCTAAGLIAYLAFSRRNLDTSGDLPPAPVPDNPDPYETAYLRGGIAEVIRLAVVELVRRRFLVINRAGMLLTKRVEIEAVSHPPSADRLSPVLQAVYDHYLGNKVPQSVFCSSVRERLADQCARWDVQAEKQGFRFNEEQRSLFKRRKISVSLFLIGLAVYKLLVAASTGHNNVGFLIFMAIVAGLCLVGLRLNKLTQRGRNYLADLETAHRLQYPALDPQSDEPLPSYALMSMALFGMSVLPGGPFDLLRQSALYNNVASSSCGSGCGAGFSCGGGSSCSGGGGSGCGGGGGGGCGGCGGGGGD